MDPALVGFFVPKLRCKAWFIDSRYGPLIWALTLVFLASSLAHKYGPVLVYGRKPAQAFQIRGPYSGRMVWTFECKGVIQIGGRQGGLPKTAEHAFLHASKVCLSCLGCYNFGLAANSKSQVVRAAGTTQR